ncbi:hypothetical protein RGQ29_030875 [Quercus rubra]|uniref:DUF4371 domain-containing protein n=1 Tax=Quercus rubra TaxID=3512 RepID=A0AAN7EJL0_QUERU|nr:hypothetical protein RGQ29_030875 [Quercus rubra]
MDKYLIRKPRTQDSSPVQDSSLSSNRIRVNFNLENFPSDLGLCEKISSYHPNSHDEIRRYYLQKGPCQLVFQNHDDYPLTYFSGKPCRFRSKCIDKDVVFCLYCYLFGQDVGKQGGDETFVTKRFKLWNQKKKLNSYVGGVNSAHNQAQSNQDKIEYRVQLNAIVHCIRFLLCLGLAFRGLDEFEDSSDKGNFLELLQFLGDHNESINEVLQKVSKNCKLTHHEIQKDIVNVIACETSKAIIKDLDNGFFSILVDESRDISVKEQMTIVLQQFLGIVHVANTTALSLKYAIECSLCEHNLSLLKLHGQGYDGVSNMQGDINGLKTLILKENKSAFYVHCFAHQLQLTLVAIAKSHINIAKFFYVVSNLVTVVGGSYKRQDVLRDAQFAKIKEELENGLRRSEQGLNQEINLKHPGDTHWRSYYGIILNLILMFSAIVDVLEIIEEDGLSDQKITNELSIALKKKNQDIVNAMDLVKVSKQRLQLMRDDERISLLTEWEAAIQHLTKYKFTIIMLTNRFSEMNIDLLLCMACLNPNNSFVAFDKEKLIRLAKFYPYDFLRTDILALDSQLQNYIFYMRSNDLFLELQGVNVTCSIHNENIIQRFQIKKICRRKL